MILTVLRNNTQPFMMDVNSPSQMAGLAVNDPQQYQQTSMPNAMSQADNWGSLFGGSYGSASDSAQTWMWEMAPAPAPY